MTKILQLLHSDEKGGVEALASLIGDDLKAAGAEVTTLFLYPSFDAGLLAKLAGLSRACVQMLRLRPDMILAYQPTASVRAGFVGRAIGCSLHIIHQTARPAAIHPSSRWLDRMAGTRGFYTLNIADSHATMAEFAGYPAAYCVRMCLIEHGISPPEPRTSRAATLARFKVADSGAILLNAGRLSEQKAQQHIIRVLPLLSDARLVLAGGGALEGSYRALAKALAVEDRIHFLGYLPRADVGDLMGAADVFVFPSEWETFSLAVAEAAMLGVPVVCSDLAVLREVLSLDGEPIGRFVASGNQTTLAAAIRRALEPGAAAHALAFAPGLRAKYSETRMLAAYRAMLWPVTGSASSAGGANEMQQD